MILFKGNITNNEIKQKIKPQKKSIPRSAGNSSSFGILIILSSFNLIFFSSPNLNNKSKKSSSKLTKFIANSIKLDNPKFPKSVKLKQKKEIIKPLNLLILLKKQNIPKGIIIKTQKIKVLNKTWNSLGTYLFKKTTPEEGINCFKRK